MRTVLGYPARDRVDTTIMGDTLEVKTAKDKLHQDTHTISTTKTHEPRIQECTHLAGVAVSHDVRADVLLRERVAAALGRRGQVEGARVVHAQARKPPELQSVDEPAAVEPVMSEEVRNVGEGRRYLHTSHVQCLCSSDTQRSNWPTYLLSRVPSESTIQ